MEGLVLLLVIIIGIAVYFIPTIVAFAKGRQNKVAIFCMNFFLGWAFIGWVIALIWALKEDNANSSNINVVVQNNNGSHEPKDNRP